MSETEKRKRRACFTGHRPEKLRLDETAVRTILENAIDAAIANGFVTFISGMARGVDIWAAEIVLERKKNNPDIRLICALPHPDFEHSWRDSWQQRYREILARADWIKTICPTFSMASYSLCHKNHSPFAIQYTILSNKWGAVHMPVDCDSFTYYIVGFDRGR